MSNLLNPFAPFDAALAAAFEANIHAALNEDVGSGDVTGKLVPAAEWVKARVIVREEAVLCGAPWFEGAICRRATWVELCRILAALSCLAGLGVGREWTLRRGADRLRRSRTGDGSAA